MCRRNPVASGAPRRWPPRAVRGPVVATIGAFGTVAARVGEASADGRAGGLAAVMLVPPVVASTCLIFTLPPRSGWRPPPCGPACGGGRRQRASDHRVPQGRDFGVASRDPERAAALPDAAPVVATEARRASATTDGAPACGPRRASGFLSLGARRISSVDTATGPGRGGNAPAQSGGHASLLFPSPCLTCPECAVSFTPLYAQVECRECP